MIAAKEIINKYLGIPYKHHGRDMSGLDCWGFVILVYRDMGYELLDISDYAERWSWQGGNYFIENYSKQWEHVAVSKPLDIVLFKNSIDVANHCGIYLGGGKFIHCCRHGVIVSNLYEKPWGQRIDGIYRLKQ
jgi:cell wall-associated NlpC family hydrolase